MPTDDQTGDVWSVDESGYLCLNGELFSDDGDGVVCLGDHAPSLRAALARPEPESTPPGTVSGRHVVSSDAIAGGLVDGFINDGATPDEMRSRIAGVIEGERQTARVLLESMGLVARPEPAGDGVSEEDAAAHLLGELTRHWGETYGSRLRRVRAHLRDYAGALARPEPKRASVGGDYMDRTINEHVRACEVLLAEEQEKARPDTALIATLCDSVRLAREHVAPAALRDAVPDAVRRWRELDPIERRCAVAMMERRVASYEGDPSVAAADFRAIYQTAADALEALAAEPTDGEE